MKRARATLLLTEMLDRLEGGEWPLGLVDQVLVFGSYARGALEPHDVDVVVEHRTDKRLTSEFVHAMSYGGDPSGSMKRALKGRSRGLQLHLRERSTLEEDGFPLTVLWTRPEPVDAARARLAALTPDPTAGRAPRDHMIEAFEGLDRWIPRPVRIELVDLVSHGAVRIDRLDLPDAVPQHPAALEALHRWTETSPLRRAAAGALAHLESTGHPLDHVLLHGEPLTDSHHSAPTPTVGIGLGWHDFGYLPRLLEDVSDWFEVIRPTRTRPLHTLHLTVLDHTAVKAR
ncbi:nucleotidyltransferase domain-containing protein [Streptomyces prunicolor]|uniref:nucleotidyltransferase domain-containing protein n=1 Tax=Streptomyces prunicolor TaxID=67348 RepID=UPI00036A01AA|nr:nucleotidyltransferase domain-containing protein [Streptomyces prunicolor]